MSKIKVLALDLMGVVILEQDCDDPMLQDLDQHFSLDDDLFYKWAYEKYQLNREDVEKRVLNYMINYYKIRDNKIFELAQKYEFAEVSNHLSIVNKYLEIKGVLKFFKYIINSSETKLHKPDPKFFEYLIKTVQVNPSEILFVDDTEENTISANILGINVFNFNKYHDQYNLREQLDNKLIKY